MSRYDDEHFLLWFTRATPTWLELSAQARGVAISVAMELNPRTGKLTLRKGLPSLAVLLRLPWEVIEPALSELLAAGKLEWDGSTFTLFDPEHHDRRRKTSTERVAEHRARRRSDTGPPPAPAPCNAGNVSSVTGVSPPDGNACNVPSSLVLSDLVSSDPKIPEEIPSARAREPAPTQKPTPDTPPEWWGGVLDTLAMSTEAIAEPALAWLRYRGHRQTKGKAPTREDALYWLGSVVIPEQKLARQREAEHAQRMKPRAGPAPPNPADPDKYTPEEQRRLAELAPMRRRNREVA